MSMLHTLLYINPGGAVELLFTAGRARLPAPDRVRIAEGESWVKRYAGMAQCGMPENLRALIGANWKH